MELKGAVSQIVGVTTHMYDVQRADGSAMALAEEH